MADKAFTVIYLLGSLYCVYLGISKKSGLYNNGHIPKENLEQYKKLLSLFLISVGSLVAIGSVIELLNGSMVLYSATYIAVLVIFVIFYGMVRKLKKRD